jgi:hypothetical protein
VASHYRLIARGLGKAASGIRLAERPHRTFRLNKPDLVQPPGGIFIALMILSA